MTHKEVKEKVISIITEEIGDGYLSTTYEGIDQTFMDMGADSLDTLEIVMAIEREYEIEIPNEEVDYIETPRELIELVYSKVKEN